MNGLMAAEIAPEVLGPLGALALAVLMLVLFYTGRILSRDTVPREDYKQLQDVNASQTEALRTLTTSVNELVTIYKFQQKNGAK